MKYILPILILLLIGLVACDDADNKIKRDSCVAVLHSGTRFILLDENGPIDTVMVTENRYLPGVITVDNARNRVSYSMKKLEYIFKNYNYLDNIYFNLRNDDLEWIGNSTINSGFFFHGYHINPSPSRNIEFEFSQSYTETEQKKYFISSYDAFIIHIEGKFTFVEKGSEYIPN